MSIFGLFHTTVTDNGPPLNSADLMNFCAVNNINLRHSTPYHPSSNLRKGTNQL